MKYCYSLIKLTSVILTSFLLANIPAQASETVEFGKAGLIYQVDKDIEKLVGKDVVNSKGDEIGAIDAILRTSPDSLQYVIISVGGFLGIGEKLVAVPTKNLEIKKNGNIKLNNVTKKDLENAPAFDYGKSGIDKRFPQYSP